MALLMNVEHLVEGELTGEIEVMPLCHFVHDKSQTILLRTNADRRCGKLATNRLSYGTAGNICSKIIL
jgi:hypothetical protein